MNKEENYRINEWKKRGKVNAKLRRGEERNVCRRDMLKKGVEEERVK